MAKIIRRKAFESLKYDELVTILNLIDHGSGFSKKEINLILKSLPENVPIAEILVQNICETFIPHWFNEQEDKNYDERKCALKAIKEIGPKKFFPYLVYLLESSKVNLILTEEYIKALLISFQPSPTISYLGIKKICMFIIQVFIINEKNRQYGYGTSKFETFYEMYYYQYTYHAEYDTEKLSMSTVKLLKKIGRNALNTFYEELQLSENFYGDGTISKLIRALINEDSPFVYEKLVSISENTKNENLKDTVRKFLNKNSNIGLNQLQINSIILEIEIEIKKAGINENVLKKVSYLSTSDHEIAKAFVSGIQSGNYWCRPEITENDITILLNSLPVVEKYYSDELINVIKNREEYIKNYFLKKDPKSLSPLIKYCEKSSNEFVWYLLANFKSISCKPMFENAMKRGPWGSWEKDIIPSIAASGLAMLNDRSGVDFLLDTIKGIKAFNYNQWCKALARDPLLYLIDNKCEVLTKEDLLFLSNIPNLIEAYVTFDQTPYGEESGQVNNKYSYENLRIGASSLLKSL